MKIFKYIALAGFAAASTELSLSGNENPDELMDILNRLSGKFLKITQTFVSLRM